MEAITVERMREIEEKAHQMGFLRIYMMENAGKGVANYIVAKFKDLKRKKIVIVAGTGNNGGDAFVVARHLTYYRPRMSLILLGSPNRIRTDEAQANWKILQQLNSLDIVLANEVTKEIKNLIKNADIIVDGIFGIGIKGRLEEPHSSIIDAINESKAFKLAVDVPSGLDPDTGVVHDKCVRADVTITFHRMKKSLPRRKKFCGKLIVEPIGIPPDFE